jgi:hypothetical protein
VHYPAGSTLVTHPPSDVGPLSTTESPDVVSQKLVYTAPMTMDSAISWYRAHPPTNTTSSGSSTTSDHGVVTGRGIFFDPRHGASTRDYTGLEVQIAVSSRPAGGVWVEAYAEAVWMPRRTVAEHVPSSATSVTVVRTGPGGRHVDTVTGAGVRTLARAVNGLGVAQPGTFNCPMDNGRGVRLTFRGPFAPKVFRADVTGCGFVGVAVDGRRQPSLSGGGVVERAVRRALAQSD